MKYTKVNTVQFHSVFRASTESVNFASHIDCHKCNVVWLVEIILLVVRDPMCDKPSHSNIQPPF